MQRSPRRGRQRAQSAIRAVVDANIWIKALVVPGGPQGQLLEAFMGGQFTLVCSSPMLSELRVVLLRCEVASLTGLDARDVEAMIAYLRSEAQMVAVAQGYELCRDPDDTKIIGTAVRGNAPIIVSQDSDLCGEDLEGPLAELGIRVMDAREFVALLRRQRA